MLLMRRDGAKVEDESTVTKAAYDGMRPGAQALSQFLVPHGCRFDLDDPDMRRWYYQTVLREASRAEDLSTHLDAATLVRLWPDLYLPKGVRRAWEEQHRSLHAEVSA